MKDNREGILVASPEWGSGLTNVHLGKKGYPDENRGKKEGPGNMGGKNPPFPPQMCRDANRSVKKRMRLEYRRAKKKKKQKKKTKTARCQAWEWSLGRAGCGER